MMELLGLLLLSYLIGAVPWGYIAGKWSRGIDVRQFGSGKTGATNTLRTLGPRMSALVFTLDLGKGIVPVLMARAVTGSPAVEAACALAAVAGHNWPVYIRFRGGRGVCTSLGALCAMSPLTTVPTILLGVAVLVATRFVSLGSLVGAIAAPLILLPVVLTGRAPLAYLVYALLTGSLLVVEHRDNIARLRAGKERRLGDKVRL